MKKYLYLLSVLSLCLCPWQSNAQEKSELVVDRFANLSSEIDSKDRFSFQEFTKGCVFYEDGTKAFGHFNYDMLSQEILFKREEQILALTEKKVLMIEIGDFRYIPLSKGYAELMLDGEVSLLIDRKILSEAYNEGGYIGHSNTAASESLGNYSGSKTLNQNLPDKIVVKKRDEFYLMKKGKLLPANKKNYLRCYPSITSELEDFLKKNKVKFNVYNDLYQLSKYCNHLSAHKKP